MIPDMATARTIPGAATAPVAAPGLTARTEVLMDTLVTIGVGDGPGQGDVEAAIARAFAWFRQVEDVCTRFVPSSEVMRLLDTVGTPTPTSEILYEAVALAQAVASASDGAFDPTIGHALERRGFDRHYRTRPTFRDVLLDPERRTITLRRPLILDLGAVAKGLAVDLAARELAPLGNYAIDAGGDIFVRGLNPRGEPWQVGLRHPREPGALLGVVGLTDAAICTSGDYERPSPRPGAGHHLLDPRTERAAGEVASVTVIAPTTVAADALATAAFVLGPRRGLRFLERQGVEGFIVTPSLEERMTRDFGRYRR
jgi:thiamine biosynthesis lipoprotein